MKPSAERFLLWAPRVLCVLFAVFVSVFALDVFSESRGLWGTLVALTMHMIPTAIVLVALAIAWRWPTIGGVLFILAGSGYAIQARHHPDWIAVIAGPVWLVGILFLLNPLRRAARTP